MSSQIDEEEKFSDHGESKMCAHNEISSLNGAENSTCQSSCILFDSLDVGIDHRDESESPREKAQTEHAMEAISRQQTDVTREPKNEAFDSTVSFDGRCSRSSNGNCLVNENVFRTEDSLQSLVPVEFESTRQCVIKEKNHFQTLGNNETRNASESRESSVRPRPEILLQPRSLRAEYSRYESISRAGSCPDLGANSPLTARFARPTGAEKHSGPTAEEYGSAKLGARRTWSVRFVKPTSTRDNSNPVRGRENRDIFENGGEQQSSRLPAGASCVVGSDEIERLSLGDSPEPRVAILRRQLSEDEQSNVGLLDMLKECSLRCLRFIVPYFQRVYKQFLKAPIFYFSSTLAIIAGVHVWDRVEEDRDVPLLVIVSFSTFVGMTFLFDRGQFSHVIGRCGACVPECRRGCGRGDPCIPLSCCCGRQSPELPQSSRRHSQYRHLEEEAAFKHEIADISKLNPKDCPQIKMVAQRERVHSESPDYPPEVSQVSADVHVGKRDGQKLGAARKQLGGRAADVQGMKQHKTRSDSSRSKHTKTFRADIHAPDHELSPQELSSIRETEPEDCVQNGDPEKSDEGVFKKFSECSPQTLPRFAKSARQSDTSSDHDYFRSKGEKKTPPEEDSWLVHAADEVPEVDEFVCEHYGQAVACSCATFFQNVE